MPAGRPRKYPDPQEFAEQVDGYFDALGEKLPTLNRLCLHLGFEDKQSFGVYDTYGPEFSITVKKARLRIEAAWEDVLTDRDHSTAGVIFNLKHNWGWKEQHALEISGPDKGPIPATWLPPTGNPAQS